MRPKAGLVLGERYQLLRRLAVGGMGEVWVAADAALGREVAIKVLREEYTGEEDFLSRLRTEARNSAALYHPNIAQVHDYGEQDGTGFLVMELVHGEPLADVLEREPTLPPRRLLPLLAQTARGLQHAHEAGVVHRDVKPGNILIERPGYSSVHPVVKITDFGVSLAANQAPMTATGMVMGTAQYLAPEQAMGKAATGLSDVYALGVVAYEASAGRRPFTGNSPVDIAVAHVNNPVPPLPPTVHPALASLIGRMLEKEPEDRPSSAGALAEELDQLAEEIAADPLGARWRGPAVLAGQASQPTPMVASAEQGIVAQPISRQAPQSASHRPTTPRSAPGGRISSPARATTEASIGEGELFHRDLARLRPANPASTLRQTTASPAVPPPPPAPARSVPRPIARGGVPQAKIPAAVVVVAVVAVVVLIALLVRSRAATDAEQVARSVSPEVTISTLTPVNQPLLESEGGNSGMITTITSGGRVAPTTT
ncbi:MAG: serine/threonine protein kinase [Promicromonosporaceae bacterium]|nr:serine/threonine protein kinase [Promicromonosporaceae bacterium]